MPSDAVQKPKSDVLAALQARMRAHQMPERIEFLESEVARLEGIRVLLLEEMALLRVDADEAVAERNRLIREVGDGG